MAFVRLFLGGSLGLEIFIKGPQFWRGMARIRKFSAYHQMERPYTRISKFNKLNFVRGSFPHIKIIKFDMGSPQKQYDQTLMLVSQVNSNIRHNALESGRMVSNRVLEKTAGKDYHLRLKVYPFHILRENAIASGAGADRVSTGMQASYGKAVSCAARVFEGQTIFELRINNAHVKLGRMALTRAASKMPCPCKVMTVEKAKVEVAPKVA